MVGPIAGPKCQWGSKDFGLGSGRIPPNGFPDARVSGQIPLPGGSALLPACSQIPGVADASFDGFGAPWSHRGRDCPGIGPEARAEWSASHGRWVRAGIGEGLHLVARGGSQRNSLDAVLTSHLLSNKRINLTRKRLSC